MRDRPPGRDRFPATRWSLVVAAGRDSSPGSDRALAELCDAYWYPVYAYLRRSGQDAEDSADLTQGFFAELLEKRYWQQADRERGRFRSFILIALRGFLSRRFERGAAQKRGGGAAPLSLDVADAEGRYRHEPASDSTPERIYERRWALTVLGHALRRLRQRYEADGRSELFEQLKPSLTGDAAGRPYSELAEDLGMTESAVKVAVHRLRRRYRDAIGQEIMQTVTDSSDIDAELASLRAALI